MIPPEDSRVETSMALMLRTTLRAALAAPGDLEAIAAARSAAQIVGLTGLDSAIALTASAADPGSSVRRDLAGRLARLAEAGALDDFRSEDVVLAAAAAASSSAEPPGGIAAVPGAPGGAAAAEPQAPPADLATLTVAEALDELPVTGEGVAELAARTRVTTHVAAALRAALEWLTRDAHHPRPFRLRAEDSLLEVTCDAIHPSGLAPAHDVLAAADGCLAPAAEAGVRAMGGSWIVRVPTWSPRPVHLMLEQGDLRLAVPWHAVLRVTLVPAIEIELRAGTLATPLLAPLSPLSESASERPVVVLGFGLKRALLVADRLVWRLSAASCEPSAPPPVAALSRAVLSDEGEEFWIAEPRVLLHDVPLPSLPVAPPEPRPQPAPARDATPAVEPSPAPSLDTIPVIEPPPAPPAPPTSAAEVHASAPSDEAPRVLAAEDVEPLVLSDFDVEPLGAPLETGSESAAFAFAPPAPPLAAAPPEAPAAAAPGSAAPGEAPALPAPDSAATKVTPVAPRSGMPEWLERMSSAARVPAIPAATRPPGRPVLLAEDSMAAQQFLARMLEQYGFTVHAVASTTELRAALAAERWVLACVDVELPDGHGQRWLAEVRETLEQQEVPCVALVRDDDDADLAAAAGLRRWLRKPFDREELVHVLRRLGLVAEASA